MDLLQNELTIDSATTLLFTTTVARFYDFYANRREFSELILELHDNVCKMHEDDVKSERPIIRKETDYVNKLTVFFWTCALITANSMILNTFIEWYLGDETSGVRKNLIFQLIIPNENQLHLLFGYF